MSQTTSEQFTPKLAAPGAGIPLHHKILLRVYVKPFIAAKSSPEASKKTFKKVTDKILDELEGLTAGQLTQKVLVPPQAGLEDSSRFWSIAMTLEHLGIVGRKISTAVTALSENQPIVEKADTGKMKPFGQISSAESLQDFKKFALEEFSQLPLPSLNPKNRFLHPWFGMMNNREWYWLLGAHQGLHLKQIREIKKGLSKGSLK
ncbi:MAG: DinB family protein [Pseudobdellovibrionaceae bacterium]